MPVLQVLPTCLFRGINVNQLIESYNNHEYAKKPMPEDIVKVDTNVYDLYGDSPYDQIYSMTDGNQLQHIVCTTGHKDFSEKYNELRECTQSCESFIVKQLNDSNKPYNITSRCRFCTQDFNHRPIGVPFKVEETTLLVAEKTYKNITIYHCAGKFHNFRCALGYIERKLAAKYDQRDARYIRAKYDLNQMYMQMHPDGPFLKPAEDPDILDINDGSATLKEYNDDRYQYVSTGNIVILPCKEEYSRSMRIKSSTSK